MFKRFSTLQRPARWALLAAAGGLLLGWLVLTPHGLLGKMDAFAYAVCHRIESHTLYLGDRPLPLCARCTGMYLGALLGLLFQSRQGNKGGFPPVKIWIAAGLLFAAFALDGVNSFLHFFPGARGLYEPTNTLRLLTGSGAGLALALMLYPVICQTLFVELNTKPAVHSWRQFGVLALLILIVDVLVLSGNPLLVYPLAVLSGLAVPLVLGLVYAMLWLVIFHKEGRFTRLSQAWFPLAAGLATVLLHVALIDAARFLWTGTWGGLPIG